MRELLEEHVDFSKGEEIRMQLHENAKANYVPKYPEQYLQFMNDNDCSFKVNHPQSKNHPYYFTLFCCKSQHVMGDCVEECLDKAIDA